MITEILQEPIVLALLLSWFINRFEPIEEGLTLLIEASEKPKLTKALKVLYNVLTCMTCTAFWITLFLTFNIALAIAAGIIAEIYTNVFKRAA
jgi:hypothetical protein